MEAHGLLLGDRKRQEEAGVTPEEGERKGPPKERKGPPKEWRGGDASAASCNNTYV
jgi:hypothetical protein